jgi:hypothetical protein
MSGTDAPAGTELATIERQVGTAAYWRNEGGIQERYRDLLTEREAGAAPPTRQDITPATPTPPAKLSHRELCMEHDRQNRTAAEAWRKPPEQARRDLPPAVVAYLDAEPAGFDAALARIQDSAAVMVRDIGDEADAQAFLDGLDRLPAAARNAVYRESAAPAPGHVRPANDKDLAEFRTLHGGKEMIAAWGMRARRCVGLAMHRFQRILAGLPADDASVVKAFVDRQPPRVQLAMCWRLGSPE